MEVLDEINQRHGRGSIRLAGEGEAGVQGGPAGDLYIFLSLAAHKSYLDHYTESANHELMMQIYGAALREQRHRREGA